MLVVKKIHETQSTEEFHDVEKEKIYTPIEDLQRITAGGVFKRNHLKAKTLPKGIKWIGYLLAGFIVVSGVLIFVLNLL